MVLRPDLSRAFRPVAPRARLRATSPVVRLVSMVLPGCMVSIAAARPIFVVSRVAPRAYSANSYTRNSYTSYGYGHGYRYWPYAAAAAYAYGRSYASSDDGCYYVSTSRRYGTRRVLVCHGN